MKTDQVTVKLKIRSYLPNLIPANISGYMVSYGLFTYMYFPHLIIKMLLIWSHSLYIIMLVNIMCHGETPMITVYCR